MANPRIVIDLDSQRAARQEKTGKGPLVKLGGKDYDLPSELPYEVAKKMAMISSTSDDIEKLTALDGVLEELFGGRVGEFKKENPTIPDVEYFIANVLKAYGAEIPES